MTLIDMSFSRRRAPLRCWA